MKSYCIGGGIGSLAAAAFMVRDAGIDGKSITIFESLQTLGGSLDGARLPDGSYSLRGGRMLTTDHYESFWDLYRDIPSLDDPDASVYEDVVAFNKEYKAHSKARLVDGNRHVTDTTEMGFSMGHRVELAKLMETPEDKLGDSRITDWFSPSFFETNFWFMWQTTFAFQPWHSANELRRYLRRFISEFPRIETLAGVKRTRYNQYDTLVRPLVRWLEARGVVFEPGTTIDEIETDTNGGKVAVTGLHAAGSGGGRRIAVGPDDLVILQNGSMTDASSIGSMTEPPVRLTKKDSRGWVLWERLAEGRPEFGNPAAFNSSIPESCWYSFSVTCRTPQFFDRMIEFSGNEPGTGGLVTFTASRWLMSVVLYHQPHFQGQPDDLRVFWGYALHPDMVGDYVSKTMEQCGGADILKELCGHLKFDESVFEDATCVPCRMPYITSMFMPRKAGDRPKPIPSSSVNLAMISQFVEIPGDVVFTVEYSVRAAQHVVYQHLNVDREIPPITAYDKSPKVLVESLIKSFA